jgi:hypothetical protein
MIGYDYHLSVVKYTYHFDLFIILTIVTVGNTSFFYSHSIVLGGLEVMSYRILLTLSTSLTILDEILSNTSSLQISTFFIKITVKNQNTSFPLKVPIILCHQ